MPLLGRHKSLGTGTTNSTATQNASSLASSFKMSPGSSTTSSGAGIIASSTSTNQCSKPQLCESPMFGLRKQLDIKVASQVAAGGTNNPADNQSDSCNSIPQQITRQQIHYAFSIMDTDSDGLIDLRDLSQMLSNLGVPIDEAILSHIMSKVSKRGDHRIGEVEFLEWISAFIQVSEPTLTSTGTKVQAGSPVGGKKKTGSTARPTSRTRATRSSTTGASSLIAQPTGSDELPAAGLRNRRGSGSGLALMRSLSSGSTSTASSLIGSLTGSQSDRQLGEHGAAELSSESRSFARNGNKTTLKPEAAAVDDELRSDLKAAFCVFDLDGDGYITLDEVRAGLKLLGESWTPAELSQVFAKCSRQRNRSLRPSETSGQQRINIDDFVLLLL